jgi:glycosyltransferase involved in cell wall biosynthesis
LIIGGGGHRNILRAAYHLETFGHDVRLYFSDTQMTEVELRKAVRRHFYPFEGTIKRFKGHAAGEDVLMATHWSTVALAESVKSSVGEIMYFVQDFEPAFYPMGSEYILAENTYRKNLYAITSGPWCAHILKRDYAMEADSFRFPVDRSIYNIDSGQGIERAKRILFFAKPEMDRRCFLIGAMALREFHKIKPDYQILFFGSGNAAKHKQDYPVTYLDIVPTLKDLAKLYATSAAGLVFSTTNPSLVPYEMMACGLPVVDLDRPGNEVNYDGRRDIALLADADPMRMAQDIAQMLDQPAELAQRSTNGLAFAATFPSEEEMARRVEKLIIDRLAKQRDEKQRAENGRQDMAATG